MKFRIKDRYEYDTLNYILKTKKGCLVKNFKSILGVKIVTIFIIIVYLFSPISFADDEDEEEINTNSINEVINLQKNESIETSTKENKEPIINAKSAIIYDRLSKKIMWGKNINDKRAMASTTKIMTAIVVLENTNLEDVVIISKKAAGTGGSRLK